MTNAKTIAFSKHPKPLILGVLLGLYWLNQQLIKSKKLTSWLWQLLHLELYYISGACQHSGHCCHHIHLVHLGQPIATPNALSKVQKQHAEYRRFYPSDPKDTPMMVNCHALTKENRCADYENRPQFCRDYPMSQFAAKQPLHKGCGYQITRRYQQLPLLPKSLKEKIESYENFADLHSMSYNAKPVKK